MPSKLSASGEAIEIVCPACQATNRIPARRLRDRPVCGRCRERLVIDHPVEVTDENFEQFVRDCALPVLVDFWAPWCGPCRVVAPELEQVAREGRGELVVAKLNSDENPRTSSRYGIRAIPTMVLFTGGEERKRLQGAMRAAQILAEIR